MTDSPQLKYRGSDFERMRNDTHAERIEKLLIQVMNHAENMATKGHTDTTYHISINEDLEEELMEYLKNQQIYAELLERDEDGESIGVYMRLEEYNSEDDEDDEEEDEENEEEVKSNPNKFKYLILTGLALLAMQGMYMSRIFLQNSNWFTPSMA